LNSVTLLLPEGKKSKTQPFAGKCMLSFLGLQWHHTQEVHGQRYTNQLQDLHEDPKEAATTNCIQWAKKGDASST